VTETELVEMQRRLTWRTMEGIHLSTYGWVMDMRWNKKGQGKLQGSSY
jgi:hypothetical protein